ncbi:hypothetical protein OPW41_17070 [Vibrio europaeus]|uniref:Helix-turn-helix domain-containing protein n=1 Tax=Vibrio europaeus TaxID=300876 RepID=A0A178JEX8_9VIBR|nr:hypothetical protein [Vibrio europaeus]MDC5707620.1 hypothetical protein [Vibrio europaeus]MDC5709866.1 hypothetical protein [Vibrio europaeus]MDC5716657.1 hypothetical protein [Vibrio europaeus]MDC5722722.1 hypothetical protein [Vibrio europaeus]MDC5726977.1 hypothetical protein [Vibrio europaeus]
MSNETRKKAIKLFLDGDAKHRRTVNIIEQLLEGKEPIDIANSHGIAVQTVRTIRRKYIKMT